MNKLPHKILNTVLFSILFSGVFAASASAAIFNIDGFFNATYDQTVTEAQGVPALEGQWSFVFDDSGPTISSGRIYRHLPLDSFLLNPAVLGATTFDTSNVFADVVLTSDLSRIEVVWIYSGSNNSTNTAQDDFALSYVFGKAFNLDLSTASHPLYYQIARNPASSHSLSGDVTGSYTIKQFSAVVPEPSTFVLLAIGLIGLFRTHQRDPH